MVFTPSSSSWSRQRVYTERRRIVISGILGILKLDRDLMPGARDGGARALPFGGPPPREAYFTGCTKSRIAAMTKTYRARDSIRARPMIIAVWIRPAAPGCRAMASTALAVARPWPSAHTPEAIAIPIPAASTANGLTHPPAAPASAAQTPVGITTSASRARSVGTKTRRTSLPPFVSSMPAVVIRSMVLGFLDGAGDVEHREHTEDKSLEKRHQNLQRKQEASGEHNQERAPGEADQKAQKRSRGGPVRHPERE